MKRLFASILLLPALFSCVREMPVLQSPECNGTPCTLIVEDAEWADSKSSYTPGVGVGLDGTELFGLFYDYSASQKYGLSQSAYSNPVQATTTGTKGIYSFTAPSGTSGKNWYAIVPYGRNANRVSGARVATKVPNIQFPKANSFDPAADILISKPFQVAGTGTQSGTISAFKRMTSPLRIDVKGLPEGEKIYALTLSFDQTPVTSAGKVSSLTGWCTFNTGQSASDCMLYGLYSPSTAENAVSAVYPEGLPKSGASWPVWLSVLPTTFAAGAVMTVSVVTAKAEYSRTVTLPSEMQIQAGKINDFSFNALGSGCWQSDVISQDFINHGLTGKTTATRSYVASDGNSYQWGLTNVSSWTAASYDGGSNLTTALSLQHGDKPALMLPQIGKNVKKVRLYLHPLAPAVNAGVTVSVKDGDEEILRYEKVSTLTRNSIYKGAGYIEIDCPTEVSTLEGKTVYVSDGAASNVYFPVTRIALFTSGAEVKTDCYDFDVKKYNVGETRKLDTFDAKYTSYLVAAPYWSSKASISYDTCTDDYLEGSGSFKLTYSFSGKSTSSSNAESVWFTKYYTSFRPDFSFNPVGVSLYVKGKSTNAGKLRITLLQDNQGGNTSRQTYSYTLSADVLKMEKWVRVFVPFSEFAPSTTASQSVKLQLKYVYGIRLEIDNDTKTASEDNSVLIDCLEQLTSYRPTINPDARFNSIFIQLNSSYVGADWENILTSMKEVGIDTVIIPFALRYRDDVAISFYSNCKVSFIKTKYAIMDNMFPAAEKLGVKIIVGSILQRYVSGRYDDKTMYETLFENQKPAIDDIASNFGSSPSFAGWYSPDEFHDGCSSATSFVPEKATSCLAWYEEETCKYMKSKKNVPASVAPALWRGFSPDVTGDFFYRVFSQTPSVDKLYLQDCSGRGPEQVVAPYIDLPNYYAAIKDACERTGVAFGVDLESFMSSDAYQIPHRSKTWEELLPPLTVASQYTDMITNFSYLNFKPGIESFEQYKKFAQY